MGSKIAKRQGIDLELETIGGVLKKARENLGYSYRKLSEKCGVSPMQLLRIEQGKHEYSLAKFVRVCVALGVPVGSIIEHATVFNYDFKRHPIPADVLKLIGSKSDPEFKKKQNGFDVFIWNAFQSVRRIITDASALAAIREYSFTSERLRINYERFAHEVEAWTNRERVAALEALQNDPYKKLTSLGLFNAELVASFINREADQGFHFYIPAAPISAILGS